MAKIKLNPVLERVRGKIGDLVFRRYEDETILARKPDNTDQPQTAAQAAQRERFQLAARYAKAVFADPVQKAVYVEAAKAKGVPPFSLPIADYFNAPEIEGVDLSGYAGQIGDVIAIRAHDDFEVVGVEVIIRNTQGEVVERGAAGRQGGDLWHYAATVQTAGQPVAIEVTATDRPGHKAVRTYAKG